MTVDLEWLKAVMKKPWSHRNRKLDGIARDTNLVVDLGYDSLDLVELAMEIEDETRLSLPDEELEELNTAGELIDYLNRKLEE